MHVAFSWHNERDHVKKMKNSPLFSKNFKPKYWTCDPRSNSSSLKFCDSSLGFEERVQNLTGYMDNDLKVTSFLSISYKIEFLFCFIFFSKEKKKQHYSLRHVSVSMREENRVHIIRTLFFFRLSFFQFFLFFCFKISHFVFNMGAVEDIDVKGYYWDATCIQGKLFYRGHKISRKKKELDGPNLCIYTSL